MSTSNKTKKNVKERKVSGRVQGSQKVDPMQLELLEMFRSRKFSKQELIDIRKMLSDYYFDKVDEEMDKLFEEKGWDVKEKVKEWGEGHYRSHGGRKKSKT